MRTVLIKATPHKARLTALHAICVQIFRHIAQKSLAIRQYACGISRQSAEKSDNAPYAQALCGVAFRIWGTALLQHTALTQPNHNHILKRNSINAAWHISPQVRFQL